MTIVVPEWQPAAGPQRPVETSPARVPGSVRRTTTVDVPFPGDGSDGVHLVLRGRDLRTGPDGAAIEVDTVAMEADADFLFGAIERCVPSEAPAAVDPFGLVGASLRSGFARHLAERHPADAAARPLRYSALDDLPGAFLVSGYSMLRLGTLPDGPIGLQERADLQADVCTGWASGGPLHDALVEHGTSPTPFGPHAPDLAADDPAGWHEAPPLAVHTVRRRRLLDVAPDGDGYVVHAHLRDTYAAEDHEMVMHEYVVEARVDGDHRVHEIVVEPRVLPWAECPGASAHAQRVLGAGLDELGARVRSDLAGTDGCTHLSSTLRAVADVASLIRSLDGAEAGR